MAISVTNSIALNVSQFCMHGRDLGQPETFPFHCPSLDTRIPISHPLHSEYANWNAPIKCRQPKSNTHEREKNDRNCIQTLRTVVYN